VTEPERGPRFGVGPHPLAHCSGCPEPPCPWTWSRPGRC